MRVCVVGAGGVGGLVAAVLRRVGVDVSLLVTERHLAAIRKNGLAVIAASGRFSVEIRAETNASAIGICDVVVVTPKMWALEAIAPTLKPLLAKDAAFIPVQTASMRRRVNQSAGLFLAARPEAVVASGLTQLVQNPHAGKLEHDRYKSRG